MLTDDPDLYRVIFANERVRVLEYRDKPGDKTSPHNHPDSVLYPLASFRRFTADGQQVEVALTEGQVRWLSAQEHSGENIGDTETHALFIELEEPPHTPSAPALGPE
ncbi:cupin domain-containing protein [Nocardia sp. CA-151230]|uniref:cupin domain-containing protein n=1 Tax=Nocardia sp. CA-151230 TaxID=3239982 RepID=UPI003D910DD9